MSKSNEEVCTRIVSVLYRACRGMTVEELDKYTPETPISQVESCLGELITSGKVVKSGSTYAAKFNGG